MNINDILSLALDQRKLLVGKGDGKGLNDTIIDRQLHLQPECCSFVQTTYENILAVHLLCPITKYFISLHFLPSFFAGELLLRHSFSESVMVAPARK